MEVCARIKSIRIEGTNHLYYNLYILLVFPLLYYIIYRHTIAPHRKKKIVIVSAIALAIIIVRVFTTPFLTHFMVYMYILAMITLVINLLIYAIDLLKTNQPIVLRYRLELFIFCGFLIFGVCYIPISFFMIGLPFFTLSQEATMVLNQIQMPVVILMNTLFIFGLFWTKKIEK